MYTKQKATLCECVMCVCVYVYVCVTDWLTIKQCENTIHITKNVFVHAYMCTQTYVSVYTQTLTHRRTHTLTYTHIYTQVQKYMYIQTHTYTHYTPMNTDRHTRTYMHTDCFGLRAIKYVPATLKSAAVIPA